MKIGMTGVFVNDPVAAFRFYTEVLGFKEKLFRPEANLAIVVSPEEPLGTALLLEPTDNPMAKKYQPSEQCRLTGIVLMVEDMEKEFEKLKESDVVFKNHLQKLNGELKFFLMILAEISYSFTRFNWRIKI